MTRAGSLHPSPDMGTSPLPISSAIVLAGGRSRRMGVDKAGLSRDGASLLQRVVAACAEIPDVVVVGPPRPGHLPTELRQVQESPAYGGPVAGIAAGLAALWPAPEPTGVLVLACDYPRAAEIVALLTGAAQVPRGPVIDGIALIDREGWQQNLAAVYRRGALSAAVSRLGDPQGVSVRRLVGELHLSGVEAPPGVTDDVDDPAAARRHGLS